MKKLLVICIAILLTSLLLGMNKTTNIAHSESDQPFHIDIYQKYTVNAGDLLSIVGNLTPYEVGNLKFEIYGDIVLTEGWNISLNLPKSLIPGKKENISVGVQVSPDAYNKEYGFTLLCMFEGEVIQPLNIYVTVENGQPYEESRTRYNYTGCIVGENIPRDVYLPVKGFPNTVWYKVPYYGRWSIEFRMNGSCQTFTRWDLEPDVEYSITDTHGEEWSGGIEVYTIRLLNCSENEVEKISDIISTLHCPGGINSPPPIDEQLCKCLPDVNGDGCVNLYDAVMLLSRYGAKTGDKNYLIEADFDRDGQIFLYDAVMLLSMYGVKA